VIIQQAKSLATQASANSSHMLGNQNPMGMLHSSHGNTCTSIKEGLRNPVDVAHDPRASSNATHTTGIQNPPVTMANQVHGLANNGTAVGSQNPTGMTMTNSNIPNTATTQGRYNPWQPQQGRVAGQGAPGYPWMVGQGQMQYLQNPNYWYPYHPGLYAPQQVIGSQVPPQVQQGMGHPP